MHIVSNTSKSVLTRLSWDEYSLICDIMKSYYSHLRFDEDGEVWVDDGSLVCCICAEDKELYDKLVDEL